MSASGFPTTRHTRRTHRKQRAYAALLAALALAAVFNPAVAQQDRLEFLNVVGAVPLEGEALTNQIVVFFDKPIALPADADGKQPSPLTVKPKLHGTARIGPNFVAYAITADLKNVTRIVEVTLNPALQSADGRPLNPEHRTLRLATFRFEIQRLWVIDSTPEQRVIGLLFPIPVALADLKAHLAVAASNGDALPFQVQPGENTRVFRLLLHGDADPHATITLTKGLETLGGEICVAADLSYGPRRIDALWVKSIQWHEFQAYRQEVDIEFAKPVHADELKRCLTIRDVATQELVGYDLRTGRASSRHRVGFNVRKQAPLELLFTISQGLRASDDTVLASEYTQSLKRAGAPLRIERHWWHRDWGRSAQKDGLVLQLRLSRHVTPQDLKAHLEFDPPVEDLRIESPYSGNFRVYGDWASRCRYEAKITPGLKDESGGVSENALTIHIKTQDVPAYAGFEPEGAYYFPRRNGAPLRLVTRNADEAKVTLYRLFASNICVALKDMADGRPGWNFNQAWCEQIGDTEVSVRGPRDRLVRTPVDLEELFPADKRGVFCLAARAERAGSSTKLVLWTDIGALAHWQDDQLVLFAHDLISLAPVDLAKVTVYSSKNQALGTGNTDDRGIARLGPFDTQSGTPRVAVIERGDDYTFLELKARNEGREPELGRLPPYDAEGYDAFIYADRDLYRPGETVHAHWLVRTNGGDALADVPLLVKVIKPNGRDLLSQAAVLSPLGTGGLDVATKKVYATGRYAVQLLVPGNDTVIGSYSFNLEDFVPNRIKAAVELAPGPWRSGVEYAVHVNAQHLFGAPATGRTCEAVVVLERHAAAFEQWPEFRFGNDSEFMPEPVECGQLKTDASGDAAFTFAYQAPAKATFPMTARVIGRVFELGGRPVVAKADTTLFPSDVCLGVNTVSPAEGEGIEVQAAAVTPDGAPAALDRLNVTLERQVWNYYVRRYRSNYESKWSESFEPIETREVALTGGRGSTLFTPAGYGYYRVRVHSDQTPQYSTRSFYSYRGRCHAVQDARPSLIKIALDKESYTVGDRAEIRIESPFDGQGIVVVQGERIQEIIPVDVKDEVGVAHLTLGPEQCPNVWVEATVIHTVQTDRAQVYPFSSFAMANVKVEDPERRLAITLPALPEEIRPACEARFEVEVRDAEGLPVEAELTLAAVDEGIHGITLYESPDPYTWLFRPRRPDFRRAHYYDKVAYDFDKAEAGGDGLRRGLDKHVPTIDENWIRPVALWSGTVRTGADGRAAVTMPVPEFTGQLRLDAVACTDTALGSHSDKVFVRRPYMLRTSLPRFLLPGDAVQCRATLFNQTGVPCQAEVRWSFEGAIQAGAGSKVTDVPAHGEQSFLADFAAGRTVGQGAIRWVVTVRDGAGQIIDRLDETDPIPVRPPASFQSHHEMVVLHPGETREFRNTRFLEDDRTEMEVTVGATPQLRLLEALRYVVGYPYGCVEQTTSRLLPMYLLRQNAALVASALRDDEAVDLQLRLDDYIESGILRLFAMQTTHGGLATWPGSNRPYPYGSVYALHFLTLVKKGRDFDLPAKSYTELQEYVRSLALDWSDESQSSLFRRAYALYVLALDGDLKAIEQIERFDAISMPRHARFLLAAALAQNTQDHDRVKLYLSTAPSKPYTITEPDGALNSDIRNTAIELLAMLQMHAEPEQVLPKVEALFTFLEDRGRGTTQETAFIVTAIAEYFSTLAAGDAVAAGTVAAPDGHSAVTGARWYQGKHRGPGAVYTVANTGAVDLYVNVAIHGIPEKPDLAAMGAGGLSIKRSLRTQDGKPYTETTFAQPDSFVVDLAIGCARELKNIVVADLLPAGFEIENSRLDPDHLPSPAFKGAVHPAYLDMRDDRLLLALEALKSGEHHFYYVVRAVTPGSYQYPAAQAECMYDSTVRARSDASEIAVE